MFFAIIHSLMIFLKLVIISIFTENALLFKFVLIIILITILYRYYTYIKHQKEDPTALLEYYKIKHNKDKIFSFIIIIIYIGTFICGILFLRIYNMDRTVNIQNVCHTIYITIQQCTIRTNIINLTLLLVLVIYYIFIIYKLTKYTKKHIIKLHIYYASNIDNFYTKNIRMKLDDIEVVRLITNFKFYLITKKFKINVKFLDYRLLGIPIDYHITILLVNLHYILFAIIFMYDMLCNNYVLHYTYKSLPYLFLYNIYVKVTDFYGNKDFFADNCAHNLIYYSIINVTTEEVFIKLPNGSIESYSASTVRYVYAYLQYELNAVIFRRLYEYPNWLAYNYLSDWKIWKNFDKKEKML